MVPKQFVDNLTYFDASAILPLRHMSLIRKEVPQVRHGEKPYTKPKLNPKQW